MKKVWMVLVLVLFLITTNVFADNAERIKELTDEAIQLQQNLANYQQVISNIQVRIIQINAVINELKNQDLKEEVVN